MVVHAGVVSLGPDDGVLVLGSTGAGKSTLTALIAERLHGAIATDDSAWIDGRSARGFGAPLAIREGSPLYERACSASATTAEPRMLALPGDLGIAYAEATAISRIVIAGFGSSGEPCVALSPSMVFAHLLGSLLQTADAIATDALLDLAASVPGHRLAYDDADSSMAAVEIALATTGEFVGSWQRVSRDELDASAFGTSIEAARFGDDAALWHRATGQVVCLDGWPVSAPVPSQLRVQLNSLGFMAQEAR